MLIVLEVDYLPLFLSGEWPQHPARSLFHAIRRTATGSKNKPGSARRIESLIGKRGCNQDRDLPGSKILHDPLPACRLGMH